LDKSKRNEEPQQRADEQVQSRQVFAAFHTPILLRMKKPATRAGECVAFAALARDRCKNNRRSVLFRRKSRAAGACSLTLVPTSNTHCYGQTDSGEKDRRWLRYVRGYIDAARTRSHAEFVRRAIPTADEDCIAK
jgi:hypothetical protein